MVLGLEMNHKSGVVPAWRGDVRSHKYRAAVGIAVEPAIQMQDGLTSRATVTKSWGTRKFCLWFTLENGKTNEISRLLSPNKTKAWLRLFSVIKPLLGIRCQVPCISHVLVLLQESLGWAQAPCT